MFWGNDNKKGKTLELPYPIQLEWYDPEEKMLETVGPAVKNDGILLYERA